MLVHLVDVGEETSGLDGMLAYVDEHYGSGHTTVAGGDSAASFRSETAWEVA